MSRIDDRCLSDLHAADARYHDGDCKRFTNLKQRASKNESENTEYNFLSDSLWNRVFQIALRSRGDTPQWGWDGKFAGRDFFIGWWEYLTRSDFEPKANEMLQIQEVDNQDEIQTRCVTKSIVKDFKDISRDKNVCQEKIDLITCRQYVSSILSKFLKYTSPTFSEDSLAMILVGNTVPLQVSLQEDILLIMMNRS